MRVAVFAKGEKEKEALDAGADYVGRDDLIERHQRRLAGVRQGVATPDLMGSVARTAKSWAPGPDAQRQVGTVTFDVAKAVNELKGGKVEFGWTGPGVIHAPVGRSLSGPKSCANLAACWTP